MGEHTGDNSHFDFEGIDRQWFLYVVLLSMVNFWVAVILAVIAKSKPLHTVLTDGSLVVFCLVSIWLTFASFRQELTRRREGRGTGDRFGRYEHDPHGFWKAHDSYAVIAGVVTFIAAVVYTALLLEGNHIHDGMRIGISIVAAVGGMTLSRRFLSLAYDAGDDTVEEAEAR